jgi:hypothetical protein
VAQRPNNLAAREPETRMPRLSAAEEDLFALRQERSAADLWPMLQALYGEREDYPAFCEALNSALYAWAARPADLKRLDLRRDLEPDWFQRPDTAGYVFYIDRFAATLKGVLDKLDYLEDLGITFVHLMPCLMPRPGDSDGGYSVMDYRTVNSAYGTMRDFERLGKALRQRGISLCVDLVLNHTAKEHEWARAAARGDPKYRDYYLVFDDDRLPRRYEETLLEVFPDNAPGNFMLYPDLGKWVWTTFNEHQWDLNWANPQVFLEIVEIMLYLANRGVDVMRLDAVAFMWKRMGTKCQSEPEVHMILRALRAASRIAAPAVIHLEEAIVSPAEMLPYLGRGLHDGKEGNLAYRNSLMVQFWSALAGRDTRLMMHVLGTHFPPVMTNATYATYLRCHDDIAWAVTDEDAAAVGLDGFAHRAFLSEFLRGRLFGQLLDGRALSGERGHRRQAHLGQLRLAVGAREGARCGRSRRRRARRAPHPDGPRADRQLGWHSADLHGRRAGAPQRPLLPGAPGPRARQPLDPSPGDELAGRRRAPRGRHALGPGVPRDPPHPRPPPRDTGAARRGADGGRTQRGARCVRLPAPLAHRRGALPLQLHRKLAARAGGLNAGPRRRRAARRAVRPAGRTARRQHRAAALCKGLAHLTGTKASRPRRICYIPQPGDRHARGEEAS